VEEEGGVFIFCLFWRVQIHSRRVQCVIIYMEKHITRCHNFVSFVSSLLAVYLTYHLEVESLKWLSEMATAAQQGDGEICDRPAMPPACNLSYMKKKHITRDAIIVSFSFQFSHRLDVPFDNTSLPAPVAYYYWRVSPLAMEVEIDIKERSGPEQP
jgi:hypothetical protein